MTKPVVFPKTSSPQAEQWLANTSSSLKDSTLVQKLADLSWAAASFEGEKKTLEESEFRFLKHSFKTGPWRLQISPHEIRLAQKKVNKTKSILENLPKKTSAAERSQILEIAKRCTVWNSAEKPPHNSVAAIDWLEAIVQLHGRMDLPLFSLATHLRNMRDDEVITSKKLYPIYQEIRAEALPSLEPLKPNTTQRFKPLRFTPFNQVTAWNHPVPIKVKVGLTQSYGRQISSARLDGLEVDFFAQTNRDEPQWIGTAITDRKGFAAVHHQSSGTEEVTITHRLKSDPRGNATWAGKLYPVSANKPVIAVDLDDLQRNGGTRKVLELVQSIRQERYQPILIVNTQNNASTYERIVRQYESLGVPILYNDVRYSGFHRDRKGFGEGQLEKLKRLKYVGGLPIVGVYSRVVENEDAYRRHGIKLFSGNTDLEIEKTELRASFNQLHTQITRPDFDIETFTWDGLTDSVWQEGNTFKFQVEHQEAYRALTSIIDNSETFLSIRNASNIPNDAYGKKLKMKLLGRTIKGTQKPNPKIRMMMDGMLGNFVYFSNPGMSWASERDVETFRAMGIDYVVIPADRFIDQDEPAWGIGTRHHTKFTIGDVDGRAIAFGGGRHYSSAHFDDKIPPKDGINIFEKMASIERGSFHEISYTVQGPVVRPIHETFMDDFESNGGKKIENRASMLASDLYRPASHPGDSSGARYVDHHSYQDQNCSNVVSLLLEDRKSDEVTFVNSFTPTEEVYEGLKLAARHGKKVRLVIGSLANIYDWIRDPRFEELLHVGVEIYLVPERLHTKLYGNSRHYAFGNHNLDDASLKDDEDLMVVRKESNAGKVQNKYVDSLIERATPLHVEWRKGVKLSEILDRAYEMKDPPEEKISKEEDTPFLEVANHLVLEGFDLGLDIVSGVTREVLGGRFVPPLRGTAVYLDGKLGGGLDLNFGNMGERYVASPKPDWRTFFISQYAFKLGLYYFDRDFLFTGGFASRSAPIELRLGDYTPQISWDNYTGLTLAESIDNHFGVRIQSGTYLHLQGETLGGRFGLHRANTFLKPAANFDPMSIDPLIMNPNTTYLTLDASASFENDRAKYSFGPYAAIKPNSNDLSYGLFGKLKWYKAYPRDEIMSFKASVQKDEDDLRGYLQFEIPFTGP